MAFLFKASVVFCVSMCASLFLGFWRCRNLRLLVASALYGVSAWLAFSYLSWWPLVIGYVVLYLFAGAGGDSTLKS